MKLNFTVSYIIKEIQYYLKLDWYKFLLEHTHMYIQYTIEMFKKLTFI